MDDVTFLPRPVQRPGIPVWVAVRYGNAKPLRRAARHDGVFPVSLDQPDQLAEIVAEVKKLRAEPAGGSSTAPFDVAIGGAPGTDPAPFATAGATWWMVDFDWRATSVDEVRGVLRDGPPR